MVRKHFLYIGWVFFICSFAFAQTPLQKQWDKRYGGTGDEVLSVFIETADRGFIAGGWSSSGIGGDKTETGNGGMDYWIVKTDSLGNKIWDKRFGGSLNDELHSLQQTTDGGYILGGFSRSGISGDKTQPNWDISASSNPTADYWIVKIDSAGNKEWDKRFGGIYEDELYSVRQTADGGFILGGISYSTNGGDRTQPSWGSADYWIVKTDAVGSKEWDKRYGGTNNDQLYTLQQTTDGGYILGGYTWSQATGDKTQPNCGTLNNCDFWIIKTDSLGSIRWDKRYGGTGNDEIYSLQQTNDNGYILAGYSWSGISGDKSENNHGPANTSDYWIVKIDSVGNKLWDKDFGGVAREEEFGNVVQTTDKGYLMAGSSYSDATGNKSEVNLGVEQTWVVKIDSLGNKQWDKTVFTAGHDESGIALQTKDGCYAFANYSNSGIGGYKTQLNRDSSNLTYDYFIAKFIDTSLVPLADFTVSENAICMNRCVSFTNHSLFASSYHWIFSGATPAASSDENPQNVCYHSPGTYDVTLIAYNSSGNDTVIRRNYITVFPNPSAFAISQSVDTLFALPGYSAYQWYHSSTAIQYSVNYFYIPVQNGNYNVLVTDSNGCKISAGIFVGDVGVHEIINSSLEIFPNPVTEQLNISVRPISGACHLSIVNMIGQEVYARSFADGIRQPFTLTHEFETGVYTAILKGSDFSSAQRFVVK